MIMNRSKTVRWIIPFKEYGMVRVNINLYLAMQNVFFIYMVK